MAWPRIAARTWGSARGTRGRFGDRRARSLLAVVALVSWCAGGAVGGASGCGGGVGRGDVTVADAGRARDGAPVDADAPEPSPDARRFVPTCPERHEIPPEYTPSPGACSGNVGCTEQTCRPCAHFCSLCDGEWCVAYRSNYHCEDRARSHQGFARNALEHAVWREGVAGQFTDVAGRGIRLIDAAQAAPTELRWVSTEGVVETRALVPPVTLVTEALLAAGVVDGTEHCGADAPPERLGPAAIPVRNTGSTYRTAAWPVHFLTLARVAVAWVRIWADADGQLAYEWLQHDARLVVRPWTWPADVVATAPLPAEVAAPIADAWPGADGAEFDWVAALDELPAMVCRRLGVPIVAPQWEYGFTDERCDLGEYWDEVCPAPAGAALDCGRGDCDAGLACGAYEACGTVRCFEWGYVYATVLPCPGDSRCGVGSNDALVPCQRDDVCDPACPVVDGWVLDRDCVGDPDAGAWCPGGSRTDECRPASD